MSSEKTASFVKRWDTPRSFWETYKHEKFQAENETRQLDWSWIQKGDTSEFRKIGPALCKAVWNLYTLQKYPADDDQLSSET